jgi:hypothetical protein
LKDAREVLLGETEALGKWVWHFQSGDQSDVEARSEK